MSIIINAPITFEINEEYPFLCFECGDQFPSSHKLNIHCSQTHTTLEGLYNIQKESHGYFKCPKCILVFGKVDDVEEHLFSQHNVDIYLEKTIHRTLENLLRASEPSSSLPVIPSSQIIIQKPPPIRVSAVQSLALSNENDVQEDNGKQKPLCNCGKCYTCHTIAKKGKPVQLPVIRGLSAANLQRIPANNKTINVTKPAVLAVAPSTSKVPVNVLCFQCGRGYDNAADLKNHSCTDGSVKKNMLFSCSKCKKGFEKCEDLQAHEDGHSKIIRPYKCGLCGIDFSTANNLEIHVVWHNRNGLTEPTNTNEEKVVQEVEKIPEIITKINCPDCKQVFQSTQMLVNHMEAMKHFGNPKKVKDPLDTSSMSLPTKAATPTLLIPDDDESDDEIPEKSFKCSKCLVSFGSEKFLKEHSCTEDKRVFKCVECDINFESQAIFDMHTNYKHKKTFKCEKCNVSFDGKIFLTNHIKTVHDDEEQEEEEEEVEPPKLRSLRSQSSHLRCTICNKSLLSQPQLNWHITSIHKICGICGTKFDDPKEQAAHIAASHSKSELLRFCKHCNKYYKTNEKIILHNQCYHSKDEDRYCKICDISFSIPLNKEIHNKSFHGVKGPQANNNDFNQCDICGKLCKGTFNIRHHYATHNKDCPVISSDEEDPSEEQNEISEKTEHKSRKSNSKIDEDLEDESMHSKDESEDSQNICKICDKKCKNEKALSNHMRSEHKITEKNQQDDVDNSSQTSLKCGECDKVCKSWSGLHSHLRMSHSNNLTCQECGKSMTTVTGYRLHMAFHDRVKKEQGSESSICKVCKKVFVTKTALEAHLKTHNKRPETPEVKPASSPKRMKLECILCKQVFKSPELFKSHKKVDHANDHFCFICENHFDFKSQLKRHYHRKHRGAQTHYESDQEDETTSENGAKIKCTLCKKNFKTEDLLKSHKRKDHANDHFCFTCEKKFDFKSQLKRHFKDHHRKEKLHYDYSSDEEGVQCLLCLKFFKNEDILKSHKKADHANEFFCFTCIKPFLNNSSLQKHFKSYHPDEKTHIESSEEESEEEEEEESDEEAETFECTLCKTSFESEVSLKSHKKVNHFTDHFCFTCEKKYESKASLKRHFENKHPDEKMHYYYTSEDEEEEDEEEEEEEEEDQDEESNECGFCDEQGPGDISKHLKKVHNIKNRNIIQMEVEGEEFEDNLEPLGCPLCFKNYLMKYNLRRHLKEFHAVSNVDKSQEIIELWKTPRDCDYCAETINGDFTEHLRSIHKIKSDDILQSLVDSQPLESLENLVCILCRGGPYLKKYSLTDHFKKTHNVTNNDVRKNLIKQCTIEGPRDCELCGETINEDFDDHLQTIHKIKSEDIVQNIIENKPLESFDDGLCVLCGGGPYYKGYGLLEHIKRTHQVSQVEIRDKLVKQAANETLEEEEPKRAKPGPKPKSTSDESRPKSASKRSRSKSLPKNTISCRLCDTKDIPELNHHLEIYHKITEKDSIKFIIDDVKTIPEPIQLKCFLCGKKSFLTLVHMRRHLKDSHLVKFEAERKKFEAMWKEKDKPSFECKVCKECFPTESTLKRHSSNHDIQNIHFCTKCKVEFDSVYDLLKHEKRHEKGHITMYSCTMCEKKFSSSTQFSNHLRIHKPLQPVSSPNASFDDESLPSVSQLINESALETSREQDETMEIDIPLETSTVEGNTPTDNGNDDHEENGVDENEGNDDDDNMEEGNGDDDNMEEGNDEDDAGEVAKDKVDDVNTKNEVIDNGVNEEITEGKDDEEVDNDEATGDDENVNDEITDNETHEIPTEILTKGLSEEEEVSTNFVDTDVVMKEKEKSPNDSTSNSSSVPEAAPKSNVCHQKLELKPLGSLLLEAVMDSPNKIDDHTTENSMPKIVTPLNQNDSLEDRLEEMFGPSSPQKLKISSCPQSSGKSANERIDEISETINNLSESNMKDNKNTKRKEIKCSKCNRVFENEIRLNCHLETHVEHFHYKCIECKIGFTTMQLLEMHEKSHNTRKWICKVCQKSFEDPEVLKNHNQIHEHDG
ncbi:hypothetical protein ACFFRR_007302 [Megaselia abdita]